MPTKVELNKSGLITSGRYSGWSVYVQDDADATGGYLILLSRDSEGYDDWVPDRDALERYFVESAWTIEWRGAAADQADAE